MKRSNFKIAVGAGIVLALLAAAGFAQGQPAQQQQGRPDGPPVVGRAGRRHMGGGGHKGGPGVERRVLGRLNLTDAQRTQLRAIEERYAEGFRAKREELRGIKQARRQGGTLTAAQETRARQIREELRESSGKMREEVRGLLTDEQRGQLKASRDELRQRHEGRRGGRDESRQERRQERRQRRQQRQPATPGGIGQI